MKLYKSNKVKQKPQTAKKIAIQARFFDGHHSSIELESHDHI